MLNLVKNRDIKWSESLRPRDEGTPDQESFSDWWHQHSMEFQHIHPKIIEQWIFRHWRWAHFQFLDLKMLDWSIISMTTTEFFDRVHLEYGGPADAEHDYNVFANSVGGGMTATATNWKDGTWTIPALTLATPEGIVSHAGKLPDVRMTLVEGSLRYRWLNALHKRGEVTGPHKLYLLQQR